MVEEHLPPQSPPLRLALFEPDIPQNAGTLLRLGACLGVPVDFVGPAGFPVGDYAFRRAGMDYLDHVRFRRHTSFEAFEIWRKPGGNRLVLATTSGDLRHIDAVFAPGDIIMMGSESAGVPAHVHAAADLRVTVPMRPGLRALNVAVAAAIVLCEAMRQIGAFPALDRAGAMPDAPPEP